MYSMGEKPTNLHSTIVFRRTSFATNYYNEKELSILFAHPNLTQDNKSSKEFIARVKREIIIYRSSAFDLITLC